MPAKFRSRTTSQPASHSPERLFDDLPRTRDRIPSLWAHQADMLRRYQEEHLETPDIALELPTGAGKTLPALLIAEWRRTTLGQRVAYACPNHQLAHQVAGQAARQGIDTVTLVGSHHNWEVAKNAKYEGARAIAVTTYSTIFNSNPALTQPETLIFDDAHAGEQYVASAWSVPVDRRDSPNLFDDLLEAIKPELSDLLIQRLAAPDPDPSTRRDVRLLSPTAVRRRATAIDRVLGQASGDVWFRYTMIRDRIDRCLLYYSWSGFLIRPYIPPTGQHAEFADAAQRLYISATLGHGGELERAFGRAPIERLPVPEGWDRRGSGRRFFVFPELVRHEDPRSLAKAIVTEGRKALVLAPSDRKLQESLKTLVPQNSPVFSKGDIERTLETFAQAEKGVLALANRYDGIDLPDDSCRLTVLDGAPTGDHLQERFFVGSLRAGRVLEERLRTRVVQGAGRCTRGLNDYSLVVVLGDDLTLFFSRSEVQKALRSEIQAEITFGLDNSDVTEEEILEFVTSFSDQDEAWESEAEPVLADLRREATVELPDGTRELAYSVDREVKAWERLWRGDFTAASRIANDVAGSFTADALQSYRAFWLYLAYSWLQAAAEESADESTATAARALLRKAHGAAGSGTWLRETSPLPPGDEVLDPLDELAVEGIAQSSSRTLSVKQWAELASALTEDLAGTDAVAFERGLTTLGGLLGSAARKPSGKGRADSVWLFDDAWWLTLEAKSEAKVSGRVSMDDVRQANTQLKSLAADRDVHIPTGSVSLIVTPKQLADPDAVAIAEPNVFLCSPGDLQSLASDVIKAWEQIRVRGRDLEPEEFAAVIRQEMRERRCLPTQVRERLTVRPVAG